ncbi:hypothetical protein Tco_1079493 [Tanacetum coccineum]|uniref:Uncharacterized protein n=1 Tax=Tanacetum coccineum TaxID=301880 RepID=A0ABQ5HRY5_9ASTR
MMAICRIDVPVVPKAPKTSSHSEKIVPQGTNPRASSYASAIPMLKSILKKSAPMNYTPQQTRDQTKSARGGLKIAQTDLATNKESRSDENFKKIKLEDLSDLMKDTRSAFFTLDSPQDEPIIVLDESEEVDTKKHEDTHATSHDVPDGTTSVPTILSSL